MRCTNSYAVLPSGVLHRGVETHTHTHYTASLTLRCLYAGAGEDLTSQLAAALKGGAKLKHTEVKMRPKAQQPIGISLLGVNLKKTTVQRKSLSVRAFDHTKTAKGGSTLDDLQESD
eukprot:m.574927 g.574927  ORF g.574927 m.574927 type:complete len:117 (-) comp22284_c1_seq7:2269-2619(-)